MYGLDRATGDVVASLQATEFAEQGFNIGNPEDLPSLALVGDIVVVASSTLTTLTAVSATNLQRKWRVPFAFGSPTRITADSGRIYAGAAGGQFAAYDVFGHLVWSVQIGDLRRDHLEGLAFPPAIDSGQIYLPGAREVYAFRKF